MSRLLSAIFFVLLVSACTTEPKLPAITNPDPDNDGFVTTKQLGAMIVLEGHIKNAPQGTPAVSYAFANFQSLPEAADLPTNILESVFDTCFVSEVTPSLLGLSITLPGVPNMTDLPFVPTLPLIEGLEPVDAGAELKLNLGSAVYTTLPRKNNAYTSQPLAGQVPGGLTVTIPGAVFPAFENVALPANVPTFSLQSPSDPTTISSETEFTWTTDTDTFVLFFGSSTDAKTRFTCYAKDDGSFTFPLSTMMAKSGFTGKLDGAARLRYATEFKNDNLFMPMIGSLEFYPQLEVPTIP